MISPKVLTPSLLACVVGVILVLTGDKTTGETLIFAALGIGVTGYAAPPGSKK